MRKAVGNIEQILFLAFQIHTKRNKIGMQTNKSIRLSIFCANDLPHSILKVVQNPANASILSFFSIRVSFFFANYLSHSILRPINFTTNVKNKKWSINEESGYYSMEFAAHRLKFSELITCSEVENINQDVVEEQETGSTAIPF